MHINLMPQIAGLCLLLVAPLYAISENEKDGLTAGNGSAPLNVAKLEQIQAETLLLEAQAERAKARLSLQQHRGEEESSPTLFSQALPASRTMSTKTSLPRILEISGEGQQLRTRLLMPEGGRVELRAGQRIPGSNQKIKRITPEEVQITNEAGDIQPLAFAE